MSARDRAGRNPPFHNHYKFDAYEGEVGDTMGRGKRVRITGLMPVYNALSAHYPFLEGIVLACEIVDEMVIQDGGSTDGTREAIEELAKCLPVPLRFVGQ